MKKKKDWNDKPYRAAGFPGPGRLKEAEDKLIGLVIFLNKSNL